jgi:hypothetical protein
LALRKDDIFNILAEIQEELNHILENRLDQIAQIQKEVDILKERIKSNDKFISQNSSFLTAEQCLAGHFPDTETYLNSKTDKKFREIDLTRKFFAVKNPDQLLIVIKYNGKHIEVYFSNPQISHVKPQSEQYINNIIQPLMNLKEFEPDLEIKLDKQDDLGNIIKLIIKNVFNFENAELVFDIFKKLIETS